MFVAVGFAAICTVIVAGDRLAVLGWTIIFRLRHWPNGARRRRALITMTRGTFLGWHGALISGCRISMAILVYKSLDAPSLRGRRETHDGPFSTSTTTLSLKPNLPRRLID